ncbi:MAG: nitroreductase [Deltaproteobacteria bacterium]|nr:nitroreductase [Deltaproteobacteria bacterium]
MELLKAIKERRSVRHYRSDTVPDEILTEVLEAARRSPSWANTQVCRFIVVKDAAIKERLRDCLGPQNPARAAMIEAPVIICNTAQRNISGCRNGTPTTNKGDWFMFDAGIAMEHIALAAWSFGLGTVHVGSFDAKKAEELLQVPEGYSITEMMPVGYFDEIPRETPRRPLSEIAYLNKFGQSFVSGKE